jgi:hypothetical protein
MMGKWNFNVWNIFGLFMVLFYIAAGLYILITHTFDYVKSEVRTIFGIILILYGIFRGARIYVKLKNPES